MTRPEDYGGDDPRHHAVRLREMLTEVARHAREDVGRIDDPKAQALFETAAEVCGSLATTMQHYESGSEAAWAR
jgi:hypothetical protein